MPTGNTIELSEGRLYIKDTDEPLEIYDGEVTYETEYVDEQEPYIKISQEPVTLTCESVEFARGWTMVKCKECGYQFPVTEFYALICGTEGWTCPRCSFNRAVEDARKRRTNYGY